MEGSLKKPKLESDWWIDFVKKNYPQEQCLKNLKCSRKTYLYLVKFLKPYTTPKIGVLENKESYLRKSICVEKQVAVLLFKLTTNADYVTISRKFDIHKTTIHKIIYKVVSTLNKHLLRDVIRMPNETEAEIITKDFEYTHEIPQIIGVMTIVHIPIFSPINLNYKFLNSNRYSSFVLQSVLDSNYNFRDISVRHAGATEAKTILTESNIYKYSNKVVPSTKINLNGTDVSYKIIGPPEGPLYSWLLSDYTNITTSSELLFNNQTRKIRTYANKVIVKLRSRFLILSQMMDLSYKVAPQLIAVCCIIHNLCEKNEDPFLEDWKIKGLELMRKYPQPEMLDDWDQPNDEVSKERDAIKNHLNSKINSRVESQDLIDDVFTQATIDHVEVIDDFD